MNGSPKREATNQAGDRDPASLWRWRQLLPLLLLALLHGVVVLQWSARHGRLAQEITFDDNGYFIDGLQRLNALHAGGLPGLWTSLWQAPPHSPYSSLTAMTAFAFCGVEDWAPYFSNSLLIFLLLWAVDHIVRSETILRRLLASAVTLSIPFCFTAVHDFRPDFAVALFTAVGVMLTAEAATARVESGANEISGFRLGLGGLTLGAAFLTKPSFFLHTFILSAYAGGLVLAAGAGWLSGPRAALRRRAVELGTFSACVILPPLPLYVRDYLHIFTYFASNTGQGADASLWRLKGTTFGVVSQYLVSGPMGQMLGNYLWVFSLVLAVGAAVGFLLRERRFVLPVFLSTAALGSLAIMIYGRLANSFFGLTYQILLLFGALAAARALRQTSAWLGTAAFVVMAVALFGNLALPGRNAYARSLLDPPNPEIGAATRGIAETVLRQLPPSPPGRERAPVRIGFTFAGEVNSSSVEWVALKHGLVLNTDDAHRLSRANEIEALIAKCDLIVAVEPGTLGPYPWLPSTSAQGTVLEHLIANAVYTEVARFPAAGGGYRMFRRESLTTFGWPTLAEGLLPIEGPFPQWGLGLVRWGTAPATRLNLPSEGAQTGSLELEARSRPGQRLTVRINGVEAGIHAFTTFDFESATIPLLFRQGNNALEIAYELSEPASSDAVIRAVLYRNLEVRRR